MMMNRGQGARKAGLGWGGRGSDCRRRQQACSATRAPTARSWLATIRAPIRARHACGQCRASRGPAEQTNSLFSPLQALKLACAAAANAGQPRGGGAHTRCICKSDAYVLGTCGESLAT